jgi:hypothetical protein
MLFAPSLGMTKVCRRGKSLRVRDHSKASGWETTGKVRTGLQAESRRSARIKKGKKRPGRRVVEALTRENRDMQMSQGCVWSQNRRGRSIPQILSLGSIQ